MTIKFTGLRAALLAGIALPSSAFAQDRTSDDAYASTDIVVTATRQEQRLQDVPLAVSALGSEELRTKGITSIADLGTGRVAGLATYSLFGSQTAIVANIRGVGQGDATQGTSDLPVAVYIDGVNMPRAQGQALELITPERIEVLRGPQGQLFGRNAEAGVIQIVSKRPSGQFSADITGGFGNFELNYGRVSIDLPEIAGFRVQISGFGREHGGYVKNIKNPLLQNITPVQSPGSRIKQKTGNYDTDFGYLKSYGGRIAIARDFGPINLFYSFDTTYAKENVGYTSFLNHPAAGSINNPSGADGPASVFTLAGSGNGVQGLRVFQQQPLTVTGYPKVSAYDVFNPYFVTKGRGHNLTLTGQLSDSLTLKSITGLRRALRNGENTLTVATSAVNSVAGEYVRSNTFSQEFQAVYHSTRFNLIGGLSFFKENVLDQRDSWFSVNCGILGAITTPCTPNGFASRPQYNSPFNPPGITGFKSQTSKTRAYAAYAQATYTPAIFDDRLELTGGLRYSDDTKRGRRTINNGVVLATPINNRFHTSRVDPTASVKVKLTDDVSAYVRYATGFRDGGANVRSSIFNVFGIEKLTSIEAGFKSQLFDRRLTLNVSAFRNDLKNEQFTLQPDPFGASSITDTYNKPVSKIVKGIEVEFTARLLSNLTISGNYSYLTTRELTPFGVDRLTKQIFVPEVTLSPDLSAIPSAATIAAHPNSTVYLLGARGIPTHSGSIAVDYAVPITEETGLKFHVDWVRASNQYGNSSLYVTSVTNGVATPKPTYNATLNTNLLNARVAMAGIPLGTVRAEIAVWGKNILDTLHRGYAFGAGNGITASQRAAQSTVYLAPPATYGVEMNIKF